MNTQINLQQGRQCRIGRPGRRGAVSVAAVVAGERQQKYARPDKTGRYGSFGGRYVPETLIPALDELEFEYKKAQQDPAFKVRGHPASDLWQPLSRDLPPQAELDGILKDYVGRETPLYYAERLSEHYKR